MQTPTGGQKAAGRGRGPQLVNSAYRFRGMPNTLCAGRGRLEVDLPFTPGAGALAGPALAGGALPLAGMLGISSPSVFAAALAAPAGCSRLVTVSSCLSSLRT